MAAAIGEDIFLNVDKLMQAFTMFDKVRDEAIACGVGQEWQNRR